MKEDSRKEEIVHLRETQKNSMTPLQKMCYQKKDIISTSATRRQQVCSPPSFSSKYVTFLFFVFIVLQSAFLVNAKLTSNTKVQTIVQASIVPSRLLKSVSFTTNTAQPDHLRNGSSESLAYSNEKWKSNRLPMGTAQETDTMSMVHSSYDAKSPTTNLVNSSALGQNEYKNSVEISRRSADANGTKPTENSIKEVNENSSSSRLNDCYFRSPWLAELTNTHLCLAVAILGIIANGFTIAVLRMDHGRGATHLLLMTLAIEDLLIIILYSLYYTTPNYKNRYQWQFLNYLLYIDSPLFFMVNTMKMAEIYTVVLLSIERFMAIRWPLKAVHLCSRGRTKRAIFWIFAFCIALKLPDMVINYEIITPSRYCQNGLELSSVFACQWWFPQYQVFHYIIDQICSFIVPLFLLLILNTAIILKVRRANRRRAFRSSAHIKPIRSRADGKNQASLSIITNPYLAAQKTIHCSHNAFYENSYGDGSIQTTSESSTYCRNNRHSNISSDVETRFDRGALNKPSSQQKDSSDVDEQDQAEADRRSRVVPVRQVLLKRQRRNKRRRWKMRQTQSNAHNSKSNKNEREQTTKSTTTTTTKRQTPFTKNNSAMERLCVENISNAGKCTQRSQNVVSARNKHPLHAFRKCRIKISALSTKRRQGGIEPNMKHNQERDKFITRAYMPRSYHVHLPKINAKRKSILTGTTRTSLCATPNTACCYSGCYARFCRRQRDCQSRRHNAATRPMAQTRNRKIPPHKINTQKDDLQSLYQTHQNPHVYNEQPPDVANIDNRSEEMVRISRNSARNCNPTAYLSQERRNSVSLMTRLRGWQKASIQIPDRRNSTKEFSHYGRQSARSLGCREYCSMHCDEFNRCHSQHLQPGKQASRARFFFMRPKIYQDSPYSQNQQIAGETRFGWSGVVAYNESHSHQQQTTSNSATGRSVTLSLVGVVTIFVACEVPTAICLFTEIAMMIAGGDRWKQIKSCDPYSENKAVTEPNTAALVANTIYANFMNVSTSGDKVDNTKTVRSGGNTSNLINTAAVASEHSVSSTSQPFNTSEVDKTLQTLNMQILNMFARVNRQAYSVALILVFVGCASNFFIYILVGKKFRLLFVRLLKIMLRRFGIATGLYAGRFCPSWCWCLDQPACNTNKDPLTNGYSMSAYNRTRCITTQFAAESNRDIAEATAAQNSLHRTHKRCYSLKKESEHENQLRYILPSLTATNN